MFIITPRPRSHRHCLPHSLPSFTHPPTISDWFCLQSSSLARRARWRDRKVQHRSISHHIGAFLCPCRWVCASYRTASKRDPITPSALGKDGARRANTHPSSPTHTHAPAVRFNQSAKRHARRHSPMRVAMRVGQVSIHSPCVPNQPARDASSPLTRPCWHRASASSE